MTTVYHNFCVISFNIETNYEFMFRLHSCDGINVGMGNGCGNNNGNINSNNKNFVCADGHGDGLCHDGSGGYGDDVNLSHLDGNGDGSGYGCSYGDGFGISFGYI